MTLDFIVLGSISFKSTPPAVTIALSNPSIFFTSNSNPLSKCNNLFLSSLVIEFTFLSSSILDSLIITLRPLPISEFGCNEMKSHRQCYRKF